MDPLSILSIAAAVVAFVDFGGKILSSASHHLRRDNDLTTALEDLAREAGQLGRLGRRIESTHGQSESSASQNPEFDAVLVELARESTLVSEDVETLISTLQTTNGNRKATTSLRLHLLKTAKDGGSEYSATERKVRKAEQRLSSIKSAMMSAVLACLWYVRAPSFVVPVVHCLKHQVLGPIQDPQQTRSAGYHSTLAKSIPEALRLLRLLHQSPSRARAPRSVSDSS